MKAEQVDANYHVAQDGEPACAACANFVQPSSCEQVNGEISPAGTCSLFAAKTNIENYLFGGETNGLDG